MARIKIIDLPKNMKISGSELSVIRGGSAIDGLLGVIDKQAALVDRDTARLWEDFFIGPCDSWEVPYIGDLVATRRVSGGRRRY